MSRSVRPSPSAAPRLRACGLTVARGRRVLVEGLDLEVGAGEVVHVAGENGCGKSSLLRVLAGEVAPRSGSVERAGAWTYVPERMALPDALPARRWLGMLGAADAELPTELDRRCGALSKGQLQRVALTAALHRPAGLIILDEPWSGLDTAVRGWLERRLATASAAGAGVLFTDHDGRGGGLAASMRLVIGDGAPRVERVTPTASARVRIVLSRGEQLREEHVAVTARDGVIAGALADGWGIERVEPVA